MKKMMALFWTLLLFPTLALANSDMVSISELRQQVEAMGQWTQTYEAHGRTIEVDVPIIVPEVDELPIVTVQAYNPYSETELFSSDDYLAEKFGEKCPQEELMYLMIHVFQLYSKDISGDNGNLDNR